MSLNEIKPFQILDGGLATELENRGHNLNDDLWSARLLLEQPDEIVAVHRDYLDAGADIVTSASYQATVGGFEKIGVNGEDAQGLISRSVDLARQACQEFLSTSPTVPVKVAAGVGPYGAALADGSEYTGDYPLDSTQLYEFHYRRWHLLLSAEPDLVLCETIPNAEEAKALIRLTEETKVPVWMSFSCRSEREISDGTLVSSIVKLILDSSVYGIGINCTMPGLITPLVTTIRNVSSSIPILVYPNSGETYQMSTRTWTGNAEANRFADLAREWIERGVEVIGGCCRTTPHHIRSLRDLRDSATPKG